MEILYLQKFQLLPKKNLDKLKENIILQSDLLDLKANFEGNASGVILESRIDKGKGPVSTVLVTNGSLKKGDFFVSGNTWGKIRAMINDEGHKNWFSITINSSWNFRYE